MWREGASTEGITPGALAHLAGELAAQRDADDEPLRPVRQVVQVDDGDLGREVEMERSPRCARTSVHPTTLRRSP
jgi:hypothetical protein